MTREIDDIGEVRRRWTPRWVTLTVTLLLLGLKLFATYGRPLGPEPRGPLPRAARFAHEMERHVLPLFVLTVVAAMLQWTVLGTRGVLVYGTFRWRTVRRWDDLESVDVHEDFVDVSSPGRGSTRIPLDASAPQDRELTAAILGSVVAHRLAALDAGGKLRMQGGAIVERDGIRPKLRGTTEAYLVPWAAIDCVLYREGDGPLRVHAAAQGWLVHSSASTSSRAVVATLHRRAHPYLEPFEPPATPAPDAGELGELVASTSTGRWRTICRYPLPIALVAGLAWLAFAGVHPFKATIGALTAAFCFLHFARHDRVHAHAGGLRIEQLAGLRWRRTLLGVRWSDIAWVETFQTWRDRVSGTESVEIVSANGTTLLSGLRTDDGVRSLLEGARRACESKLAERLEAGRSIVILPRLAIEQEGVRVLAPEPFDASFLQSLTAPMERWRDAGRRLVAWEDVGVIMLANWRTTGDPEASPVFQVSARHEQSPFYWTQHAPAMRSAAGVLGWLRDRSRSAHAGGPMPAA